jgi:density-regulated protein DRP1
LPPEYCEFGGTVKKCEEWLKTSHPDMHARIYSEGVSFSIHPTHNAHPNATQLLTYPSQPTEALATTLSTLSVDAQKRAEKDSLKKQAKAEAAEAREHEKKMSAKVLIKRVERSKRKYVTAISGLEAHGLELKKVAKELGKKFATGSSVTKVPSGGEEIVVQGDLSDEIYDWITGAYGDIPEDNIDCIEDKKKKGAGAGGPA